MSRHQIPNGDLERAELLYLQYRRDWNRRLAIYCRVCSLDRAFEHGHRAVQAALAGSAQAAYDGAFALRSAVVLCICGPQDIGLYVL